MKKMLILALLVCSTVAIAAETNYWPNNTNMYPVNLGATYGLNAYVVGATPAAVVGSIAIGASTGVAYVKDATNAVQIGAGANTTPNTVKFGSVQIWPDARGVVTTNFTFLSQTAVTGKVWIANGVVTNVVLSGQ